MQQPKPFLICVHLCLSVVDTSVVNKTIRKAHDDDNAIE